MSEANPFLPDEKSTSRLVRALAARLSFPKLAEELQMSESQINGLINEERPLTMEDAWKLVRSSSKYGFFDVFPTNGMPPVSYDLSAPFHLLDEPVGFRRPPPIVPLHVRRTNIAGFWVDFPIGLPASVLASNSNWIEFYARRGFDILTYKTVRTGFYPAHPWPNWVFLSDAPLIESVDGLSFAGEPGYWPGNVKTASMANSFGIASFSPDWWVDDVRRARRFVKEGHQLFIVSIVASRSETREALIEDFVQAALLAKKAGADVVEANYSCPNTPNDRMSGDLYKSAEDAAAVSRALKEALGNTPLFVKIGYLASDDLAKFVECNKEHIAGIVAINTIPAKIVNSEGMSAFGGKGRDVAGVSGWAIRGMAHQVARNLVKLRDQVRNDLGKSFAVVGLGGVLAPEDATYYLDSLHVDAVESCTGAFLNPYLALHTRLDTVAASKRPSRLKFELNAFRKFLEDVALHPTKPSRFRVFSWTTGR